MADEPQHVSPRQEFSSGRELIETVKARREPAQVFRAIAKPWPGGCVVMSPRARPTPTARRPPVMPPQANARPCPPWAAEAAKKPPRGGKQTPKENTRPEPAENLQEVNKRKRAPGNNTRVHKSWLLRHRHLIKPGRFLHGKKYPRS